MKPVERKPVERIKELFKESADGLKSVESDIPKKKLFGLFHKFSKPILEERLNSAREPADQAKVHFNDIKSHFPEKLSSKDESFKVINTHADLWSKSREIQGNIRDRKPTRAESLLGGAGKIIAPAASLKRLLGK